MAKKGKISELYDINSLEAQQKTVIGLIDVFLEKVNAAKPIKVQLEGVEKAKDAIKGITELNEATQEYINISSTVAGAQEKIKKGNKDLGDSFANVGAKINSQFNGSTEDAIEKLLRLTEALKLNRKAQQELQGQKDTFSKMNQDLPEVASAIDEINKKQRDLKESELVLKKTIADTNKEIKNRLNISISTPGTREEIKQTITELKRLRDFTIDINTDEGQAKLAELNAEIDKLNKIMEQTGDKLEKRKINIGNYPGAVKALEGALVDVNKKIDDFTSSGNQNKEMLEALTKEQLLLQTLVDKQSEGFNTATAAIKGNQQAIMLLTQLYGEDSEIVKALVAQTAELSDEVGDLRAKIKAQASDTKVFDGLIDAAQGLVAVYSIAQGAAALFGDENEELQKTFVKLQAVMAVLQGLQAIQNVLQKESAARQLFNIGLQRVTVLQTNLETAAQSRNIVVKYAAIAAQKALNAAMSLAGGPLLAIIGLLALVVISLSSFSTATQKASRDFEQLNEDLAAGEALLNERVDIIKRSGEITIAELEAQFADEKKIRDARRKLLSDENAELKGYLAENSAAYREAFDNSEALTQRQLLGERLSEEDKKTLDESIKFVDKYSAIRNRQLNVDSQLEVNRLNNIKATTEEEIKARQDNLEILKSDLQTRANIQSDIVGNERKSYDERRAALKEFQKLQSQILQNDTQKQLLVPTLTPSQRKLIIAQAKAAQEEINKNTSKQREDLNRQESERMRKAQFDILKIQVEDAAKANDLIAANENKSFNERTAALYAAYEKRRSIIIAQHDFDIANDTLTAQERIAIETKYLSDINNLTIEYGLQQRDLYQQNQDAVNTIIEKNQQGRLDKISSQQSLELISLIQQLRARRITIEEYERERAKIEHRYNVIALQQEINLATAKVLATKEGTAERYAAEKELADKTLALNEEVTRKQIAAQERLSQAKKELATEAVDTVNSLINFQFDNESNRIKMQMDELDRQTEKEIETANATIANKQEREEAIASIEAKAQAQREQLEKRQRQIDLDRARFEKAANIAQIISSTALAIIETLKTYKGTPAAFAVAATIGAIGAIQLAKAIAAPLPAFAEGTEDHPGGLSWVGDGGKKELVIEPSGKTYKTPATPTIMDIPKHSVILPDADQVMRDLELVAMNNISKALNYPITEQTYGRMMTKAIENRLDRLTSVVANKHELHIKPGFNSIMAMHKYGSRWNKYINEQTRF